MSGNNNFRSKPTLRTSSIQTALRKTTEYMGNRDHSPIFAALEADPSTRQEIVDWVDALKHEIIVFNGRYRPLSDDAVVAEESLSDIEAISEKFRTVKNKLAGCTQKKDAYDRELLGVLQAASDSVSEYIGEVKGYLDGDRVVQAAGQEKSREEGCAQSAN